MSRLDDDFTGCLNGGSKVARQSVIAALAPLLAPEPFDPNATGLDGGLSQCQ